MPCFLKKVRVKIVIKGLGIQSGEKLYRKLLEYYSDSELHAMSELIKCKVFGEMLIKQL